MLHAERPELALDLPLETLRRLRPSLRQGRRLPGRALGRGGRLALRLFGDGVVALDPVEGPRDLLAVGGDGGGGLAVLSLDAPDGVEALVDLPEALRIHDRPLAKPSRPGDGVLDIRLRPLERFNGRGHIGVEARELAEE